MSNIHTNESPVNPPDEFWLKLPGDEFLEKRHILEIDHSDPHGAFVDLIYTGVLSPYKQASDGLPVYILSAYEGSEANDVA